MQIESFLVRFPPFDALDEKALDDVARATQIEFFPTGTAILQRGGPPSRFLYVVRKGAVELLDDGTVIDLLDEGEMFGHPSLIAGIPPAFDVRAFEDTLCYLIDPAVIDEVILTPSGIAFLARGLARRSRQVSLALEATRIARPPVGVSDLVHRAPIGCERTTSIGQAARTMAKERVSSILVLDGDRLLGIVTDRDLRTKVIAEGMHHSLHVSEIMSSPVITTPIEASSEEALLLMLRHGFHHLVVVDAVGELVGVISDTDLMGLERTAPFALLRALDRAETPDDVAISMANLPDVVASLVGTAVDPVDIGHVIATAIDAATKRLIHIGISELGDPPGPWAWLALGSEARHEQSLLTDQDHALVFDPGDSALEGGDRYFESLAKRVTDGLVDAGIPRCQGGVMAESAAWRGDRATWIERFGEQLAHMDVGATAFSSIALDYRRIAGALDVESTIDELVRRAAQQGALGRKLAWAAVDLRPPTGFFRDFVVESAGSHAGTFDVKHGGISPITNLARAFAVASGSSANRTVERLRAARSAGELDPDLALGLEEGFRLLWRLRLEHQAGQHREQRPADDHVDPRTLGPLTRRSLREAFKLIAAAQRLLATRFGLRVR